MYFADAYPDLTQEELRSFKTTERRLMLRLVVIGCFGLAIVGVTLF